MVAQNLQGPCSHHEISDFLWIIPCANTGVPLSSASLAALISLSFGGAIGLMFLMLGCALPVYE